MKKKLLSNEIETNLEDTVEEKRIKKNIFNTSEIKKLNNKIDSFERQLSILVDGMTRMAEVQQTLEEMVVYLCTTNEELLYVLTDGKLGELSTQQQPSEEELLEAEENKILNSNWTNPIKKNNEFN